MDDNKKVYSVVGTVTIGTDEYRDLLTEKFEAIKNADEERDRWYKSYTKCQELEEKNGELAKELEQLRQYIEQEQLR